jgi:hypothetical protein
MKVLDFYEMFLLLPTVSRMEVHQMSNYGSF